MPRPPLPEAPVWETPPTTNETTLTLTLKTITPLFGGSARAREVDKKNPIRPAAIRGHLRFWWRATYGAQFRTIEELSDAETLRFGAAANHDQEGEDESSEENILNNSLRIRLKMMNRGVEKPCGEFVKRPNQKTGRLEYPALPRFNDDWPPYALQPFQGKVSEDRQNIDEWPGVALMDVVFQLELTVATCFREEILQALSAWVTFGGLGARTRRGCGSIALVKGEVSVLSTVNRQSDLLTLIPGLYLKGQPSNNALTAWNSAVTIYKDFRQKTDFARDRGTDGPGRSRWPEADSLRRLTTKHSTGHGPDARVPAYAFPRADLGLPIIFHFKDRGDPEDATIAGRGKQTRFASPVITKALALPNNQFVPIIAILNAPRVWTLGDLLLSGNDLPRPVSVTPAMVLDAVCPPMSSLRQKDIRLGLLAYARNQGFTEVVL